MSKQIQLHCPSTKATVDTFIISPYHSPEQTYKAIRLALAIPHASLYTIEAVPITKLDAIQDGQRVLVAAAPQEHMLPDSPPEYEFYTGEEADDVDPDLEGYGLEWDDMSEREKHEHVTSLNARVPERRNRMRITRGWEDVRDEIARVQKMEGADGTGKGKVDVKECEDLIQQRWNITLDQFIPDTYKPPKIPSTATTTRTWDTDFVAAVAVLSSFSHGQASLIREHLVEAIQLRIAEEIDTRAEGHVQTGDVLSAIGIVFERVGVVEAKGVKVRTKPVRAKGKERRKAGKARRKEMSGDE
ncbi:hypothetical protein FB567DRAFT_634340 [Paraphoma chrysanthemicola]|uniref:Uncharacterized protein n=1 Tax=Paraphoma chrysanthemicola TaxID=798071 RepID=A0A8K0QRV8_9PLEO|nr:hypothetical protein FB567DRAFT_634340 [Paraphoma chrysanthemicola]